MKKWSKKALCLILAAGMVLGLGACGGGNKGNGATKEDAKQYVYRIEEIKTDAIDENAGIYGQFYKDGRIYVLTSENRWDEMRGLVIKLVSFKEDGSDVQTTELVSTLYENPDYYPDEGTEGDVMPLTEDDGAVPEEEGEDPAAEPADTEEEGEEDSSEGDEERVEPAEGEEGKEDPAGTQGLTLYRDVYISESVIDNNGVYLVLEDNSYYNDAEGNYKEGEYSLTLYSFDFNGQERFQAVLNDSQDEYMWINTIASDEKGNLALLSDQQLYVYDAQGNQVSKAEASGDGYIQGMFVSKDGKLNLMSYNNDWTKMYLQVYNFQTKSFEDNVDLPGNLTNYGFSAGIGYDMLLTNSIGLYGFNIGDEDVTPIFSYINSDLNGDSMGRIMEAGEDRLFCSYYDEEDYKTKFGMMYHVDPADIKDKEVLTLACYYLDYYMRRRVVAFNKESEQYRIVVKDYSTYSSQDDWSAGYTQLNNDIISGQIPDILVLDSYNMPISSYISKGILADIGKLIEEDEELNWDDYMTNVFDAYSVNGKLYSVIPSFNVNTVIGKTSIVGDRQGWTMADLRELMNQYPQASVFGDTITRDSIIWQMMMYSGSSYVDKDSGKCNFNTQEFIDILEFATQFPAEIDWDNMDDYWKGYSSQYRENRTLLMNTSINDFRDFNRSMQSNFGEPVTFIGFPSQEGNGAVINVYDQYAIAAKSKNIEGAWEFVRYYLTEEYQRSDEVSWVLPTCKAVLLENLEKAQERPYWLNEDGSKEYYDDYYYVDDTEIVVEPLTKEEADALYEYISSANMAYSYDESLMNIITEEAAPFFAGQKSASEVVDIIQNRAQVYINESR